MQKGLPPGPKMPAAVQSFGWWARPIPFIERCRAAYGNTFTIKLVAQEPFVMHSDPDDIKAIFTAPADVLHPGEGARILEPIVGPTSILLLDGERHMSQKKLVLPAFHGARMEALRGVVAEVADREIASWPADVAQPLHPHLQELTLSVILRVVFGLEQGERFDRLTRDLTEMMEFGTSPLSLLPPLQRDSLPFGTWRKFTEVRARADREIFELIARAPCRGRCRRGRRRALDAAARRRTRTASRCPTTRSATSS